MVAGKRAHALHARSIVFSSESEGAPACAPRRWLPGDAISVESLERPSRGNQNT
jgi:hypothetical protein